jgi:putative transposase
MPSCASFVHDRLASGRAIRVLTAVDDCTRECPVLAVEHSLASDRVVAALEALEHAAAVRGLPARLVCDHGSELSSRAFLSWARARDIALDFTRPGKPVDNAYVVGFNGKRRDECLNEQFFFDLADVHRTIERWRRHYGRVNRGLRVDRAAGAAAGADRLRPNPRTTSRFARGTITRCSRPS